MKILHVNTHSTGGAAKACIRLHKGLLREGIDSTLLVLNPSSEDLPATVAFQSLQRPLSLWQRLQKRLFKTLNRRKQVPLITYLPNHGGVFSTPITPYDLTQHPAYAEADIINLHWVAGFLDYPSFFQTNTKPVVWTLHDMAAFTGGNHYQQDFPTSQFEDLSNRYMAIKQKALKNRQLHIVAPSQWLHGEAKASNLFASHRHACIPYGLDTQAFRPLDQNYSRKALGLPTDKKIILFVAHAIESRRKGFTLLHEALSYLKDDSIALCVLGGGYAAVSDLPNVYPLGMLRDERLISIAYTAADLFVIPSLEDNLPNTVLESLASGTPVVGFPIGGIPDMVIPGKNGLLSPEINAIALASTIQTMLDAHINREAIRQDALARFDESIQAQRYFTLYQELLETV